MKNKIITFLVVLLFLENGFLLYKTNSLEKRLDEYSSIAMYTLI